MNGECKMAKSVETSVRILEGVSTALRAAKETFVKEKEDKDRVVNKAFAIIEKELKFLDEQ